MRAAGLRRTVWGELLAEFLGTLVLIAFGDGVVAMAVAALNQSGRGTQIFAASGAWLLIAWGWALAVAFGVYVAGGVSGAHINPAVTLALAVRRDFPWRKVIPYWVAQVVSIFATFPAPYFGSSMIGPLIDQIVGTAFLLMFVLALTDERNQPPKSNLAPLLVGLAVAAIGMSFGANAGYAINPARDFGPRFFAWLAGWGRVALPGAHGYVWVPIIGPLIGGVVGAIVYDLFIRDVLVARGAPPAPDVDARGETVEEEPAGPTPDVEARG
jgi:glycerol uptake facilitator protein